AVGRPDVHAGPLPDGFQALQMRQVVGPVQGLGGHRVVLPGRWLVAPSSQTLPRGYFTARIFSSMAPRPRPRTRLSTVGFSRPGAHERPRSSENRPGPVNAMPIAARPTTDTRSPPLARKPNGI